MATTQSARTFLYHTTDAFAECVMAVACRLLVGARERAATRLRGRMRCLEATICARVAHRQLAATAERLATTNLSAWPATSNVVKCCRFTPAAASTTRMGGIGHMRRN
jgi:hypothetical protein